MKYSAELTAADCFELGRQSYNNGDYYHTQLWMKEAESRLKREANQTIDASDILEYLAFSTYKQCIISMRILQLKIYNTKTSFCLILLNDRILSNKLIIF